MLALITLSQISFMTVRNIYSLNFLHLMVTVADKLQNMTPKLVYKLMPSSSPNFVGCEEILQTLHDYFAARPSSQLRRRTFVLFGIGGVGKTQICLKFAEESTDK